MGKRAPEQRSAQWLGQHSLRSSKLAASLVKQTNISSSDLVVEVGAGHGMLTKELVDRATQVAAVEIDPALAKALIRRFSDKEGVLVVAGDFFDLPLPGQPFRVFGNIPFNMTTRLLHHLLDAMGAQMWRADLIVQRGVAIKRARRWNLLNVCWAPWWEFIILRGIPARAFTPPPSVDAALLTISRRSPPLLPEDEALGFWRFARATWPTSGVGRAMKPLLPSRRLHDLSRQLRFSLSTPPTELAVHQWIALYQAQSH